MPEDRVGEWLDKGWGEGMKDLVLKVASLLRDKRARNIVVLDLDNYSDHPALFAQEPRHATGVEELLINGQPVIENGSLNRVLPGRLIRND